MRLRSGIAIGLVLAHTIAVVALHWPEWWLGLLALLCWLFAWVGADEPRPTRSPRHADVRAAEQTALGQKLMYREGWIIERPAIALSLLVLLTLLAAASVVALTPADETSLEIVRVFVWAPALLLAAGFVLSTMINAWLVTGPILLFWLLFMVVSVAEGNWAIASKLIAAAGAVIAALFAVDLLRGARRGLERAQR